MKKINVFFSHTSPQNKLQSDFLSKIDKYLKSKGLQPRSLGRDEWSNLKPLEPIRQLMEVCKGCLIVGMERSHAYIGYDNESNKSKTEFLHRKSSTPWVHIEAGMAYQLGLSLCILKDKEVYEEGILDPKISQFMVFEFELGDVKRGLSANMKKYLNAWVGVVKKNEKVA